MDEMIAISATVVENPYLPRSYANLIPSLYVTLNVAKTLIPNTLCKFVALFCSNFLLRPGTLVRNAF